MEIINFINSDFCKLLIAHKSALKQRWFVLKYVPSHFYRYKKSNVWLFCKKEACVNCGALNATTLIWLVTRHAALWARIAQNVKKPPLNFLVLMYPFGSLGVPWSQKVNDTFVELFRFTRYVERNKVHFAPSLRFQWNHYIVFPDFSDIWPSRG